MKPTSGGGGGGPLAAGGGGGGGGGDELTSSSLNFRRRKRVVFEPVRYNASSILHPAPKRSFTVTMRGAVDSSTRTGCKSALSSMLGVINLGFHGK